MPIDPFTCHTFGLHRNHRRRPRAVAPAGLLIASWLCRWCGQFDQNWAMLSHETAARFGLICFDCDRQRLRPISFRCRCL